ncbi:hypothetical protein J2S67_000018 [Pseudoglutamicibacter albus]|uniref:Uncharacterized protein n=1 Tax=Pseudoglutamicibacter albus TaxID=98671 RepID=A0ABU1YWM3_9MICC|nr:hypothetical protein [Pseudoglutamicibacter albus]
MPMVCLYAESVSIQSGREIWLDDAAATILKGSVAGIVRERCSRQKTMAQRLRAAGKG